MSTTSDDNLAVPSGTAGCDIGLQTSTSANRLNEDTKHIFNNWQGFGEFSSNTEALWPQDGTTTP